jgi:hypothetical protein
MIRIMSTTELTKTDPLEFIISLVCESDQECEQLSEKAAQLDTESRELFNFMLTDERYCDEWLSYARCDNPSEFKAFLLRAREEMHKKSASTAGTVESAETLINNQFTATDTEMQAKDIPGLKFIGHYSHPDVMDGAELPLYEPAPRTDGRPSINTVEGWNRLRHDLSEQRLLQLLGRQPTEEEIQADMEQDAAEACRIIEQVEGGIEG